MPGTLLSPFTATSAWNTPIDPAQVTYSALSAPENVDLRDRNKAFTWITQKAGLVVTTPVSTPVKVIKYQVLSDGGQILQNGQLSIPIPSTILLSPASEWSMWTDLDGVHVYEGWVVELGLAGSWSGSIPAVTPATGLAALVTVALPDGTYNVNYLTHPDFVNGTGWGDPVTLIGVGGRAAGCALLGGMIHASELASSIEHALPMQLDQRQMKTGFVPPAVAEDSGNSYSGTIPMGSRFALPSILTLPATLTVEGRALAKAYQKYGGYIIDSAGGTISFGFAADDVSDPQVVNMETDCEWIRDNLVRVLPR